MLDQATQTQLKSVFATLESDYNIVVEAENHPAQADLITLLNDVAATADQIQVVENNAEGLRFTIERDGTPLPIVIRGLPGGHEFTTLILAILNADGKGKLPDDGIQKRIKALKGPVRLTSYVSTSCVNCPDVVQALNQMALIHPDFHHEMVEGTHFQEEISARKIQGVPAVFAGDKLIHAGKADLTDLLDKLEAHYGAAEAESADVKEYDVAVIGGGPAGAAAAIYTARKGLKTAIIAERIGGQVNETKGIENMISIPYTEGPQLAADLFKHIDAYPIEILEHRRVQRIENGDRKTLHIKGGEVITTGALILATGAKWRQLGIPGEKENIGRGVAFCPHCDGPFYKDKPVVVVGGGNSGVEAAIDLAGICSQVTLVEFSDQLNADNVLIDRLYSLDNATIHLNAAASKVLDNGDKVSGMEFENRVSGETETVQAAGIFVQIGLVPNSAPFADLVELNERGEIVVDDRCRTSKPGIYAAGDLTQVPYKQIIIAMGEGAKAGLSVFEEFARGTIQALS
ncbi:alkyl hydroperoxide reductase subunit F [Tichowtungia aerotolerans]|uniref:Alkyl hydroperoxide reductase subunit F n=1 Tax=Tichowtungia aerotolerans TaxID=2697043 RepID=A0A6P1M3C4_9BACT|nr:alkyl hydroperoxide reductase subunit F [Tichowtungia aerotolerans]QHI68347.1 alkyl hydroperoxide reductase subunit F [Tichowtungia aerotolerans]